MAELSLLVKATVVLAAALVASRAAGRAPASVRALVLASAFGVLLVLPIATLFVQPRAVVIPIETIAESLFFVEELSPATSAVSAPRLEATPAQRPAFLIPSLAVTLRGVWIVGIVVFAVPLASALWRLQGLRRRNRPWTDGDALLATVARQGVIAQQVDVMLSDEIAAPMTYHLVRPRIVLPIDAPGWTTADLRQALLHEMEHVRRRDWLVQLLVRVTCAPYWFHPLAWTAWRQLRLECERACDDAVLRGAERTAYAEQLVTLARRLKSSPAPLLSMADRSNLATRVDAVLDAAQARGRVGAVAGGLILSTAIGVAAAISPFQVARRGPVDVLVVDGAERPSPDNAAQAPLQPQASTAAPVGFEVASIRRNRTSDPARARLEPGGRFTAVNAPVIQIIRQAYGLRPFQVLNAPDWTTSERYDILAKAPEGVPFGMERIAPFLQALLRDRFAFSARTEMHEMPIYELVASRPDRKPGPRLEPSAVDCTVAMPARDPNSPTPDQPPCAQLGLNNRRYEMRGYPMSRFAQMLGGALDRLVVDKTGLAGAWNIELDFTPDAAASPAPGDPPSIFTALQEQLGMRLEPGRGPVEMLVIVRIERPTED